MSETLEATHVISPSVHREIVEVNFKIKTGEFRQSIRCDAAARVSTLKTIFGEIIVEKVVCEARQETLLGVEAHHLSAKGHVFVALIPSGRNSEVSSGTSADVVNKVPNKQNLPLSSVEQSSRVFEFDLTGFELDLAQDPRKQQAVTLWVGNSGVVKYPDQPSELLVATFTWRLWLVCSGNSTLW